MASKALIPGDPRLYQKYRTGSFEEVTVVGSALSPGRGNPHGWYNVRLKSGVVEVASREQLYADTTEAREFLAGLALLHALEDEIDDAGYAARRIAREAREAQLAAVRARLDTLQKSPALR